jgi:hypothetical protein
MDSFDLSTEDLAKVDSTSRSLRHLSVLCG